MSTPSAKKKSRKGLLAFVVIVIAAIVLVIPPALAGALMVPVSKVVFNETTGSLSATQATANVSLVTAYEYYFSIRSQRNVQDERYKRELERKHDDQDRSETH
jgi:UPF0716 family protein affecting phage T7 exclusion